MMKFHDQDRQCGVILSEAKDLPSREILRFAQDDRTGCDGEI